MAPGRWLAAVLIAHLAVVEAKAQYVYFSPTGFHHPRWAWPGFCFGFPLYPSYVSQQRLVFYESPPPVRIRLAPEYDYDLTGVDLDLVPSKAVPPKPAEPRPKPPAPIPPVRLKEAPPAPELPPRKDNLFDENARLIELGLAAMRAEEPGLAERRFRQAIEAEPNVARSHFLLAQTLFAVGRYQASSEAIETGMRLQPTWPKAAFAPRVELFKEETWRLHLGRLTEAIKIHPNNGAFLFLHAHQLWFGGEQPQALVIFQKARPLVADPKYIDTFLTAAGAGAVAAK